MEPIKLQKIDEIFLPEHSCLEPADRCYFVGEYAASPDISSYSYYGRENGLSAALQEEK